MEHEKNGEVDRVMKEWRIKLLLSIVLPIFFCAFYFPLQHIAPFPAKSFSLTGLDRAIGFEPNWIWGYQSIYLLMPIFPWLAPKREDLWRYTKGFFLLCSIAFLVFFLYPVNGPRPEPSGNENLFYRMLIAVEGKSNAFPSLHAGLCIYSLAFGFQIRRAISFPVPSWMLWTALLLWAGCILFSAAATKQHYVIDLAAGAFLSWLCHFWAWRGNPQSILV